MRRSIESAQRKVRQIAITISADGTTVTGLDALQVSVTDTGTGDKLITFNEAFAAAPVSTSVLVPVIIMDFTGAFISVVGVLEKPK